MREDRITEIRVINIQQTEYQEGVTEDGITILYTTPKSGWFMGYQKLGELLIIGIKDTPGKDDIVGFVIFEPKSEWDCTENDSVNLVLNLKPNEVDHFINEKEGILYVGISENKGF